jgi:hypothetical protein
MRAIPDQEFSTPTRSGCAPPTSPYPPGSSWRCLKRRNSTGSSRIPSRLAHQARPIRQSWADPTLSRLLPPSPATPGSGCLQLHPAATTARQRRSLTSIRYSSASWRTAPSNGRQRSPAVNSSRLREPLSCDMRGCRAAESASQARGCSSGPAVDTNKEDAEVEGRNLHAPYAVHGCAPPAGPSARWRSRPCRGG